MTFRKIKYKHVQANRTSQILEPGEFALDGLELYVGDGSTPGGKMIASNSSLFNQDLNTTDSVEFVNVDADINTTRIEGTDAELSIINNTVDGHIEIQSDEISIGTTEDVSGIFIGQHNINNTTITNLYGDYIFRQRSVEFNGSNISFTKYALTESPTIDFTNAIISGWEDPNIVNEHNGSASIVVGGQSAVFDDLTIRIENNTGSLDVSFNYDPTISPSAISANGDSGNVFSGTSTFTSGNTTWTVLGNLNTVGDKGEFTVVDHSSHKIYRVSVIARSLPDIGVPGDAYCVIEKIK